MSACNACQSNDNPTYIYKLVPHTSPVPLEHADLPDALPISELDKNSGFIHLSTSRQIPGTLTHFFASDPRVYVLRIPYDPLAQSRSIKWEDPKAEVCGPRPEEGLFPHLYNGLKLGRGEIESTRLLEKPEDLEGGWVGAIDKDEAFKTWLIY